LETKLARTYIFHRQRISDLKHLHNNQLDIAIGIQT
jgi:hypothetical protein